MQLQLHLQVPEDIEGPSGLNFNDLRMTSHSFTAPKRRPARFPWKEEEKSKRGDIMKVRGKTAERARSPSWFRYASLEMIVHVSPTGESPSGEHVFLFVALPSTNPSLPFPRSLLGVLARRTSSRTRSSRCNCLGPLSVVPWHAERLSLSCQEMRLRLVANHVYIHYILISIQDVRFGDQELKVLTQGVFHLV